MKKFYTLIIAGLAAVQTQAMAEDVVFGYCGDIKEKCIEVSSGFGAAAAIEIPELNAQAFVGKELSAVSIGFGSGKNREIELFLTYDLKGEPFYTQKAQLENDNSFNEVALATPYTVEGKSFFVGYKYLASNKCYPVMYDGNEADLSQNANWVSFPGYARPTADTYKIYWEHNYAKYGNNCIRLILSGETESAPSAEVSNVDVPIIVAPGESFFATVTVTNTSLVDVKNVTVDWTVGDDSRGSADLIFDTPILPGSTGRASMMMYASEEDNEQMPMTFAVTKVNEMENPTADHIFNSTLSNTALAFVRRVVVEKYTGTGCGYCPVAMYAFDRMIEEVTDGSFIPVEVHNYGSDPLHCSSYADWYSLVGITGAPGASYNRVKGIPTAGVSYAMVKAQYNALHLPTFLDIKCESDLNGNVKTVTTFSRDIASHNYGIGFILTEDQLGPYAQTNYYGNTGNTDAGPYGNMNSVFLTEYDNVARQIFDMKGAYNSIPASVKLGERYEYTTTLDLSRCKDLTKVNVIAFVANRSNGEILNAVRVKLGSNSVLSEMVENDYADARAIVEGGSLSVVGNYSSAFVYSMGGNLVATLLQGDNVALGAGVYVIRVASSDGNDKTIKVMVR